MIRADQIPDEVVEAAAKADYEHWRMYAVRGATLAWEDADPDLQEEHRESVRAPILAALNAWPGIRMMVDIDTGDDSALKLPLPQEASDE